MLTGMISESCPPCPGIRTKLRKNAQNAQSLSATFGKMKWESAVCASRMLLRDAFCAPRLGLRDASYASRAGLRGGVPGDWSGIPGLRDHRTPDTGVGVAGRTEPCACFSLTCCGCRLLTSACCIFACLRSKGISDLPPPTSRTRKSFGMHCYEKRPRKSFGIHSYKIIGLKVP